MYIILKDSWCCFKSLCLINCWWRCTSSSNTWLVARRILVVERLDTACHHSTRHKGRNRLHGFRFCKGGSQHFLMIVHSRKKKNSVNKESAALRTIISFSKWSWNIWDVFQSIHGVRRRKRAPSPQCQFLLLGHAKGNVHYNIAHNKDDS
jgi:hypothetical protein